MNSIVDIKKIAKETIATELAAVSNLDNRINNDFVSVVKLIFESKGRLILTAIGKSANISNKLVATFNSTGQPSIFLHASEAIHGDLGNIQRDDIVMFISNSGNTSEIKALIPYIKKMGNPIVSLTGNLNSFLASSSKYTIDVSVEKEACPNNLAPTSSTTAQLVMGDAIAVALLKCKKFSNKDFARFHPGGSLGKRLHLTLFDLSLEITMPAVKNDSKISEVILTISKNRVGATAVLDNNKIVGIITDGDLRRMLSKKLNLFTIAAKDIMNSKPKKIAVSELAVNALKIMQENNISQLIVMDNKKYLGIIHMQTLLKEGLI